MLSGPDVAEVERECAIFDFVSNARDHATQPFGGSTPREQPDDTRPELPRLGDGVQDQPAGHLRKDTIGLAQIVFFVIAAAAPLTAVVGATPGAFAFGNGAGVPGAFILSGLLYLLFSFGYAAMSAHMTNAGAFYAYVSQGLGRPLGVGGAMIAIVAYNGIQIALYGAIGLYIGQAATAHGGPDIPWWVYSLALTLVVYLCGMRRVDFSGKVLGVLMAAEITVLLVLDGAVILSGGGPDGLSLAPFSPALVFSPRLGISLVFVIAAYIGFEATAIFSEEARDPKRTVPLATYIAVGAITAVYALSSWSVTVAYGTGAIQEAANRDPTHLYFAVSDRLVGTAWTELMNILLITSIFASILALHNAASRYFFAIGREGLVWRALAVTHPRHQSPYRAGLLQTVIAVVAILLSAAAKLDPFAEVFSYGSAIGTVGMLSLQALVALSVIAFFRRTRLDTRLWNTVLAPAASFAGLGYCLYLVVGNMALMSGSDSPLITLGIPALVAAAAAIGVISALRLKKSDPKGYAELGRSVA